MHFSTWAGKLALARHASGVWNEASARHEALREDRVQNFNQAASDERRPDRRYTHSET